MNTTSSLSQAEIWTAADLATRFGPLSLSRICLDPLPGTGTEADVVRWEARENRLFELVDGVLVEKTLGFYEAYLASLLVTQLTTFARAHDLGIVAGADAMMRLTPGLVRIPDASFVSWGRLPNRQIPRDPIPSLVPDLAVEVISKSNTTEEMDRKLVDYFRAGVQLVWFVRPDAQSVDVYSSPSSFKTTHKALDGGRVLPGFELSLGDLFREST